MKTANWENPERSLELQPGDDSTSFLYHQAIAKCLQQAIRRAFPKPVDWNKIQACSQKPEETSQDHYNQLQIAFKENSDFPSDVEFTWVAFSCVFISGLN